MGYRLRITQTCIDANNKPYDIVSKNLDTGFISGKGKGLEHIRFDYDDSEGTLNAWLNNKRTPIYSTTKTCSLGKVSEIKYNKRGNGRFARIRLYKELLVWKKWVEVTEKEEHGDWEGDGVDLSDEDVNCEAGSVIKFVKQRWAGVSNKRRFQRLFAFNQKDITKVFLDNKAGNAVEKGFTIVGHLKKNIADGYFESSFAEAGTNDDGSSMSWAFDGDYLTGNEAEDGEVVFDFDIEGEVDQQNFESFEIL